MALCRLLGVRIPIIQAPMAGAVGPQLAAAVSETGGLGTLPLWTGALNDVRDAIRDTKQLTNRPFAVNLRSDLDQNDRVAVCLEEGVRIISMFWGINPDRIRQAKDSGAVVLQTVGSAEEARRAIDAGADVIIAQGWEAGGHVWGQVATFPLIPAVVDAADGVPVIAAGGIADGRGMAAAFALGASGVWIGTRFLLSEEAQIHRHYQQRISDASETETGYFSNLYSVGWSDAPHRVLKNQTTKTWDEAGRPPVGERPGEHEVVAASSARGDIVRYQSFSPRADTVGDIDALSLWAGQSAGLMKELKPAADIVHEIATDARRIMQSLSAKM